MSIPQTKLEHKTWIKYIEEEDDESTDGEIAQVEHAYQMNLLEDTCKLFFKSLWREGVKAMMLILAWISFLINNRPWACVYTTHDVGANDTLWLQAEERASLVGRGRGPVAVNCNSVVLLSSVSPAHVLLLSAASTRPSIWPVGK